MEILKLKPILSKKNIRKSGFEDAFFVMIVLFAVVIFILILGYSWNQISDPLDEGLNSALPASSSVNVTTTLNGITDTIGLFDSLLPFLLIGLIGFVFIMGGTYIQHPAMIIVGIIILGVALLLGVIFSNVYHQIASSTELSSTASSFDIGDIFMEHLPFVIAIMFVGIVSLILLLRSNRGGSSSL